MSISVLNSPIPIGILGAVVDPDPNDDNIFFKSQGKQNGNLLVNKSPATCNFVKSIESPGLTVVNSLTMFLGKSVILVIIFVKDVKTSVGGSSGSGGGSSVVGTGFDLILLI